MSIASPSSLLTLLLVISCGPSHDQATPTASGAPTVAATPSPTASGSSSATKSDDKSALLRSGRKLAQAGKWKEAVQDLDLAREASPDDPIILSELGFAQINAGDLTASQATSEHALAVSKEPRVRAQILYNLGRVAEANGDRDGAKKRYQESLDLRPNHAVQTRLESLGGKVALDIGASPAPTLPCDREFPNTQALCDCLLGQRPGPDLPNDAKPICRAERSASKLESEELSVLRWGADEGALGESVHLLAANSKGGLRPVAQLGRDFDPGAMGASTHARVLGFEEHPTGGKQVVLVKTEQKDVDASEGGHGLYTTRALRVTACVLRNERQETNCPFSVPLEIDETLTYDRASGKDGYDRKARFELVLNDRKAILKVVSGQDSLVPKTALGPHVLW